MPCILNAGRTVPCKDSQGGLVAVYFINYISKAFTLESGKASELNAGISAAFKYDLRNDGNNFTENAVSDKNTGTYVNTQTLTLALTKIDSETSLQVDLMAKGRPVIVVEDRNGGFRVAGLAQGMDLTGSDINTGGVETDFNGYNLTFTSMEKELAPYLTDEAVTALIGKIPTDPEPEEEV